MNPRAFTSFPTLLVCVFLAYPPGAWSDELPLWEAGLGIAPLSFPEYRGSSTQRQYVFPLPYLIYRGELFQVDRSGIRGLLVDTQKFEFDFSINGAVPVRSRNDGPREGMPDLDPVLETGVSLSWLLAQANFGSIRLRLPIRAAMATDLKSIHHVGWKAEPQLHAETDESPSRWNLSMATGPVFADRAYHSYYFGVDPEFATQGRPAYKARGGYSGWSVVASASRRIDSIWIGAFLRYDNLDGTRFTDSPLVETRHAIMAGFGVAVILGKSSREVPPYF